MSRPERQPGKRIAIICPLSPPLHSGASSAAFRLGPGLATIGWQVTFLCCKTPDQAARENLDGCAVVRLPAGSLNREGRLGRCAKALFAVATAWHLFRARRSFDLALYFGAGWVALPSVLACRAGGIPAVVRPTHIDDDSPGALAARPLGSALVATLGRSAGFVGISPRLFDAIRDDADWGRRPRALIPNAVDLGVLSPATTSERWRLRQRFKWESDEVVFLFVGVFSCDKGVGDLLDAWDLLAPGFRGRARLVLAGGHFGRAANLFLFERAEEMPRVDALGQVGPQTVAELLRAADIFVLPSYGEGLPNALLEAMACGLPGIVSRLEGINDYLIEDGVRGRLVPIGDPTRLSEALLEAIVDLPAMQKRGANGRRWIEEHASLEVVSSAYDRFLLSVLEGQPT